VCVRDHRSTQQISGTALEEFRGTGEEGLRIANSRGSDAWREQAAQGHVKPRRHHQHSICPAAGSTILLPETESLFFCFLPPEWALVSAGQHHAFVCVEPLLAHRIGVTQPGVSLMG
jgi:hypothetical protein